MSTFNPELHTNTPSVRVSGSDGATVLNLKFLRHPDAPVVSARILVSRTLFTISARTVRLYGSRPLKNAAGH